MFPPGWQVALWPCQDKTHNQLYLLCFLFFLLFLRKQLDKVWYVYSEDFTDTLLMGPNEIEKVAGAGELVGGTEAHVSSGS